MCVLCKDTFSRSDILKRHFQKCSLRRGNPTGATHLSHPQAHLKRSQAAQNAVKPVQDEVNTTVPHPNGMPGATYGEAPVNGNGMAPGRPGYPEQQPLGFSMPSVNGMNRGQPEDAFPGGQPHQRGPWLAAPKQNPYMVQPGADANGQQLNVDRHPYAGAGVEFRDSFTYRRHSTWSKPGRDRSSHPPGDQRWWWGKTCVRYRRERG